MLADEKAYTLVLDGEADLAGCRTSSAQRRRAPARSAALPGKHVITLSRSRIEPFLQFSARRDLREQAFKAWTAAAITAARPTTSAIIAEIVRLRAERARLLGYETFADFKLADTMAKTPEAVLELLSEVWAPAVARAGRERDDCRSWCRRRAATSRSRRGTGATTPRRCARREHDLDEAEIKPYLQLDRIIEAAFDTAQRLFGLSFEELRDVPRYHPDVRVWEVTDATARMSACSSAIISPGPRSAAAPG